METLNRLQRLGGARLVMVLGASGSGKSSLVRAGIVPRLKRDKDHWLVLEPFRPLGRPLDHLAMAIAVALTAFGNTCDWKSIRDALNQAAANGSDAHPLDFANDLRVMAGRCEATVLLVVDQFEELLGRDTNQSTSLFLRLLKAVLSQPNSPFLAIATLRSDFLGAFQVHEVIQDLLYEPIHLPQMALADFAQVIEGPARVAGVELEPGLAQAMVADTATDDGLPLLAFTLRELWEQYSGDGRLTLEEYRNRLGGLKGSVARAAEMVCTSLSPDQERHLHKAFLAMVRVDEEGRYIRKPARWEELPEDVHDLLEQFVQARLLISRGESTEQILEVAHDALFRSWDRLAGWLNSDREFLLWRQRLRGEITDWEHTGYDDSTLLRGPVLAEAKRWLSERGSDLSSAEHSFIQKSDKREVQELQRWKALYAKALSRQLAVQAVTEFDSRVGLLLCVEAVRRFPTVEAQRNLLDLLMKTRRVKISLYGHTEQVSCVAVSLDGKTLVSGGVDGTVVLWDMASDIPTQKWVWQVGHLVTSLDFSPNGSILATGGTLAGTGEDKGCVALWNVHTGKKLTPAPEGYESTVSEVRFSPDGITLAVASWDGAVYLWDMRNNQPKCEPFKGEGSVTRLAFSPNGKILASISGWIKVVGEVKHDSWISVWNIETGQHKYEPLRGHDGAVACLAFSLDGEILLSGGHDGMITFWDAETGSLLQGTSPISQGQNGVTSIALAPDGGTLASGSPDGSIVLWQLGKKAVPEALKVHQQAIMGLVYSPDGGTLASASLDKSVILWNLRGGELRSEPLRVHNGVIVGVAFDQSGSSLLSGDSDGEVALLNLDIGVAAPLYQPAQKHESKIWSMAFSSDLLTAASSYLLDKTIRIWNPITGEAKCQPLTSDARIATIALSPDGTMLAYVSGQAIPIEGKGEILLWDIAQAELRAKFPCGLHGLVTSLAFSQNGSTLASGCWDGSVLLWNLVKDEGKTEPLYSHQEPVLSLAFSPDGKTLASGSGQWFGQGKNTIILWDIERGQCKFTPLRAHKNDIASIAFSPDGSKLASASGSIHSNVGDADIRLWDVASGFPLSPPLLGHRDIVRCVAFSPDGKLLASGSKDGTIILWNMDLNDWVKFAALKADRELTPEEWERYLPDEPYHKTSSNLGEKTGGN